MTSFPRCWENVTRSTAMLTIFRYELYMFIYDRLFNPCMTVSLPTALCAISVGDLVIYAIHMRGLYRVIHVSYVYKDCMCDLCLNGL